MLSACKNDSLAANFLQLKKQTVFCTFVIYISMIVKLLKILAIKKAKNLSSRKDLVKGEYNYKIFYNSVFHFIINSCINKIINIIL
jgi:hypothetical protein